MSDTALAEIKCQLEKVISTQSDIVSTQTEQKAESKLTNAKVDNIALLIGKDVEFLKGRQAKTESDVEHNEKARLQMEKAISTRFDGVQKEIDRKVVEQPQLDALNLRLDTQEDKITELVGERRTETAIRRTMFGGLGLAWAAIIAIASAYIAHSGLFGH